MIYILADRVTTGEFYAKCNNLNPRSIRFIIDLNKQPLRGLNPKDEVHILRRAYRSCDIFELRNTINYLKGHNITIIYPD
jgi:hypothetical protein